MAPEENVARMVEPHHRAQVIKSISQILALDYRKDRNAYLARTAVLIHDVRVALQIPAEAIVPPLKPSLTLRMVTQLESDLKAQEQIP